MLLPEPLGPTSPIISPGCDRQVDILDHLAIAVAEADAAQLDFAADAAGVHGMRRLGHAGHPIQNLEDALRAGRGSLRHREHPAHRLQPGVEPHDVQVEAEEIFRLDAEIEYPPGAKGPYHHQAGRVQKQDERPEEGPHRVDAIIGLDHAIVGGARSD